MNISKSTKILLKNLRLNIVIKPCSGFPFSEQELIWILKTFGELRPATLVRRVFRKEFSKTNLKYIPHKYQFDRVLGRLYLTVSGIIITSFRFIG